MEENERTLHGTSKQNGVGNIEQGRGHQSIRIKKEDPLELDEPKDGEFRESVLPTGHFGRVGDGIRPTGCPASDPRTM